MLILRILLLAVLVQFILSCNRGGKPTNPVACFTVDKDTANVGDTITFTNCSDYDDDPVLTKWYFGDTIIVNNNETVQHIYYTPGQYMVYILVGNLSYSGKKTITIQ